jgi:hypothetical protein
MDYAEEQRQRWNGAAGHAWAASQAVLDRLFEPLADLATARRPDQLLTLAAGSKPFVPPSIATCTATRSASPPRAGW